MTDGGPEVADDPRHRSIGGIVSFNLTLLKYQLHSEQPIGFGIQAPRSRARRTRVLRQALVLQCARQSRLFNALCCISQWISDQPAKDLMLGLVVKVKSLICSYNSNGRVSICIFIVSI